MSKRPEKTAQTKADLEQAFWQLYSQAPLGKITVAQVCQRAGYNRGTFYLHYQDLYQLLEEIEDRFLAGMTSCVEGCMSRLAESQSKLARLAALKDVITYYEKNKGYITVLLGPHGSTDFLLRLKTNLKPLWRRYVISDTGDHTEQEIDLLLEYTLTGTLFMISRWLQDPGTVSKAQIGHLIYDSAIRDVTLRAAQ